MPLQATSGAASYDAFGGGVPYVPTYIEELFSTWLYTGNGSARTITNGIDLAGKGGLVWIKDRVAANRGPLVDTARGATKALYPNLTAAQQDEVSGLTAFTSSGFTLGTDGSYYNGSGVNYVSWAFREQPKFFDVVTYTGNSTARTIAHNLGSVPGCIIVKRTDGVSNWSVYHRSIGNTKYLNLNNTNPESIWTLWNDTTPTSTVFSLGTISDVNTNGATYVAYLFAHNAGGFGLTGTDNVISCGSYTGTGAAGNFVSLGYEPQWLLIKRTNTTGNWLVLDTMRGIATGGVDAGLFPNLSNAEDSANDYLSVNATGFELTGASTAVNASGSTYIYIAIRRGPMKVPTTGTSVLGLNARTGNNTNTTVTGGSGVTDLAIIKRRDASAGWVWTPRLTGTGYLSSQATTVETAAGTTILQANPWDVMDGVKVGTTSTLTNASGATYVNYLFDRAPSFMDVVCYTANISYTPVPHNLTVVPELVIQKKRSGSAALDWYVTGFQSGKYLRLNSTDAAANISSTFTTQTATTFMPIVDSDTNVAYLFATCAGVSKVGSYTGNGSTQTINCGFTGGARFVAVKRTDATGAWYVWDTARGMVAGSDFFLLFDATSGETNFNSIYTTSGGFEIVTNGAGINASGGTYIFLAIA
jgi:hypothetical protein